MNNKGQSVLAEHVMIFFVVIAALVAMTAFIQRGLEARIHDARDFMINSVNAVCDANCQEATNQVSDEYEPYYLQVFSNVYQNDKKYQGETTGNSWAIGAKYYKNTNEESVTNASSGQLPPECAGANPPAFCGDL